MKNVALLLAALFLGSCHMYWRNASRFQAELKCGQPADQVLALASKYGAKDHWKPTERSREDTPHLRVRRRSTFFHFWLSDDKLEAFRQSKFYGITGVRQSVRVNLCTGERTGSLRLYLMAPAELEGAAVALDGEYLGQMSKNAHLAIGTGMLHFGQHEIEIEKGGFSPILRQFTYTPKDFWPEPQAIHFTIEPGEVQRLP